MLNFCVVRAQNRLLQVELRLVLAILLNFTRFVMNEVTIGVCNIKLYTFKTQAECKLNFADPVSRAIIVENTYTAVESHLCTDTR